MKFRFLAISVLAAFFGSCNSSSKDSGGETRFPIAADADVEALQPESAPSLATADDVDLALEKVGQSISPAKLLAPTKTKFTKENVSRDFVICAEEKVVTNDISFTEDKLLKVKYAVDVTTCPSDAAKKASGTVALQFDQQMKKTCYDRAAKENGWKLLHAVTIPECQLNSTSAQNVKLVSTTKHEEQIDGSVKTLSILYEIKNANDRCVTKSSPTETVVSECSYRHIHAVTISHPEEAPKRTAYVAEMKIVEPLTCKATLSSCTKGRIEIRLNDWKATLDFTQNNARYGYADFTNGATGKVRVTFSEHGAYRNKYEYPTTSGIMRD